MYNKNKLDCLVIQFAKFPVKGNVKTRLQPLLGEDGCYEFHQRLTRHMAQQLVQSKFFSVLALDQLQAHNMLSEPLNDLPIILQKGDTLGERMMNAMTWGFSHAHKVLIVGSDAPILNETYLLKASNALDTHSHVFYPAEDGGYVMIGATLIEPSIFKNIPWGTQDVMAMTQARLNTSSHTVAYLETLWDVDVAEDFSRCEQVFPMLTHNIKSPS